jgi:hypothetical protein
VIKAIAANMYAMPKVITDIDQRRSRSQINGAAVVAASVPPPPTWTAPKSG